MSSPNLMTIDEAAKQLRLDAVSKEPKRTIRAMVRRGELRSVMVGRWTMITRESVDRFTSAR